MKGATAEPSVNTTRIPSTSSVSAIGKSQYRFRRARKRTNSRTVAPFDTTAPRIVPALATVQRVPGTDRGAPSAQARARHVLHARVAA